jgi:hypothetical protein
MRVLLVDHKADAPPVALNASRPFSFAPSCAASAYSSASSSTSPLGGGYLESAGRESGEAYAQSPALRSPTRKTKKGNEPGCKSTSKIDIGVGEARQELVEIEWERR